MTRGLRWDDIVMLTVYALVWCAVIVFLIIRPIRDDYRARREERDPNIN